MKDPAIAVNHVYKKFHRGQRHGSLRDAVAAWFHIGSSPTRSSVLSNAEFWALNDVSLSVHPGEAFGVIGPNGAGKSTLLKLLAGIMRPNGGSISIRGRLSALIEVGAGFHPDLTGRENIFLNASIMGMSRVEVRRKFDEIVEFAGIHEFLDTPIKRYSSGMYARLGFSIAAHVDPKVLLIDEVLSVGDRVFRSRCMDRMRSFLKKNVAIVFVSHDLRAVSSFCDRGLVLSAGQTLFSGSAGQTVAHYHQACATKWLLPKAKTQQPVSVKNIHLRRADDQPARTFHPGELIRVEFDVHFHMEIPHPSFGLTLQRTEDHLFVFETSSTRMSHESPPAENGSVFRVRYQIRLNVPPGEYCIGHHVRDRDATRYATIGDDAVRLMVLGEPISGGMVDLSPTVDVENLAADVVGMAEATH